MIETFGRWNYLRCDAVYWDKPVKESCPQCSMPFLLEKTARCGIAKTRIVIIKCQSITPSP